MNTHLNGDNLVGYSLDFGDQLLYLNQMIGKTFRMDFSGSIECFCGKNVDRVFRQNFCYDCFFNKPQAGEAILRPELSKAHLGEEDRDLEWEKAYQLQPHIVYLAFSGGVKVGVTREGQMPTRWIDQGASAAIILAETPNRYLAGVIEVALKDHMSDKTNVKKMLSSGDAGFNLIEEKEKAKELVPSDCQEYISSNDVVTQINYPTPPDFLHKKSLTLEKAPEFEARLTGIRGQYWLLDNGQAFNVRNHEGRIVTIDWN